MVHNTREYIQKCIIRIALKDERLTMHKGTDWDMNLNLILN